MPNFTFLGVSHSPLFLEMTEIWPFYGQNIVLKWSFKLFFPELQSMFLGMLHAKFCNHGCIQYSPFPKNGQNMALCGQNMVLTWSLKWVLPGMFHAKLHIDGCIL